MVAPNAAMLTQKPHLLCGWAAFHTTSTLHFNTKSRVLACNPIDTNKTSARRRDRISLPSANGFEIFSSPQFASGHSDVLSLRVLSGGGAGGGIGGSADGNSGGGGGGDGGGDDGSNWSLLSW